LIKIKKIEDDLYGLQGKELDEVKRKAKGRRPEPEILVLAEIHKFDIAKMIKDDKTVKLCKEWFKKEEKKRKARQAREKAGQATKEEEGDGEE